MRIADFIANSGEYSKKLAAILNYIQYFELTVILIVIIINYNSIKSNKKE